MSNMSYCRFENTLRDLQDCYEALVSRNETDFDYVNELRAKADELNDLERDLTHEENYALDNITEELEYLEERIDELSDTEQRAMTNLLELCSQITREFNEEGGAA